LLISGSIVIASALLRIVRGRRASFLLGLIVGMIGAEAGVVALFVATDAYDCYPGCGFGQEIVGGLLYFFPLVAAFMVIGGGISGVLRRRSGSGNHHHGSSPPSQPGPIGDRTG
jgi:hypothetical protein